MNNDWITVRLDNAPLTIIDGDRGKQYPKQGDFSHEGYCLFLNAGNVTKTGFDFSNCQFITKQKDVLLRKGKLSRQDVVLTSRGTLGNIAYYDDTVPFSNIRINSGMLILRANTAELLPAFLYHFVRSSLFSRQLDAFLSGSAQPQIPIRDLRVVKIPVAPLAEQRAIAAILSTWDAAIMLTERLITALQERKRGLMQRLLTGEVRFPEFEGEEWHTTTLENVAHIEMGQSPPGSSYNKIGDGYPLINGPTEFTERLPVPKQWTTKPTKLCKPGDVLLCVRGSSTGRMNIANDVYCIGRGVAAIRALDEKASTDFLEYLLHDITHRILSRTAGSTFPNIDKNSSF